jgi:hypothetical protein
MERHSLYIPVYTESLIYLCKSNMIKVIGKIYWKSVGKTVSNLSGLANGTDRSEVGMSCLFFV